MWCRRWRRCVEWPALWLAVGVVVVAAAVVVVAAVVMEDEVVGAVVVKRALVVVTGNCEKKYLASSFTQKFIS